MQAGADAARQTLLKAGLQRVVDRVAGVRAKARRALIGDSAAEVVRRVRAGAVRHRRVRVNRLEQSIALRADVADPQHEVARELALHFETERVVVRRVEVLVNDGLIDRVRVEGRVPGRGERIGDDGRVAGQPGHRVKVVDVGCVDRRQRRDRRHERERAPDVERDVREHVVVRARVAATQNELVAARQPAERAAFVARVPVEAESRLEVVVVAARNRPNAEARIVAGGGEDGPVEINQIADGLARILVAQAERQAEVRPNLPLVLHEEEEVVPVEVKDARRAREVFVDVEARGLILDEKVERGVFEQAPRGRLEELMQLVAPDVAAELDGVVAGRVGHGVLQLVRVTDRVLRQIDAETDGRARRACVEAYEAKLDDLD